MQGTKEITSVASSPKLTSHYLSVKINPKEVSNKSKKQKKEKKKGRKQTAMVVVKIRQEFHLYQGEPDPQTREQVICGRERVLLYSKIG